jgi:hypothetical protein
VRIRIAWMVKSRIAEKVHFRFGHGRMPRLSSHLGRRLVGRLKVCRCDSYGDFGCFIDRCRSLSRPLRASRVSSLDLAC